MPKPLFSVSSPSNHFRIGTLSSRWFIGLDPGKSGAATMINSRGAPVIRDNRLFQCRFDKASDQEIIDWLETSVKDAQSLGVEIVAALERVGSSPDMGVSSAFSFGMSYGLLKGSLAGLRIRYENPTPQKWQKELGCVMGGSNFGNKGKGGVSKKNQLKALAHRLWPHLSSQIIHQNAASLLLAEWLRKVVV